MCIVIVCFPVCDVANFEVNLSFLIKKTVFLQGQHVKTKFKYLKNEKLLR